MGTWSAEKLALKSITLPEPMCRFDPAEGRGRAGCALRKRPSTDRDRAPRFRRIATDCDHFYYNARAVVPLRQVDPVAADLAEQAGAGRSEEHTSELQSLRH